MHRIQCMEYNAWNTFHIYNFCSIAKNADFKISTRLWPDKNANNDFQPNLKYEDKLKVLELN